MLPMQLEAHSQPICLEDRIDHMLLSCEIRPSDREQLLWLLAHREFLSDDVFAKTQRVLYGIRHGLIHLI